MGVEAVPAAENVPQIAVGRTSYSGSQIVSKIDWRQNLAAIFFGLFIALILSVLLRGGGLALGMLSTGYLAVYLYHRRNPFSRLTMALGARLGAICGALGFGILAIVSTAAIYVSHAGPEIHDTMLKAVHEYVGRNSDPQMQQILQFYGSREGFILMLVLGAVVMFGLFTVLSSVGGMIGAAVLRRKQST